VTFVLYLMGINRVSPTRGLPGCVMRLAAIFVNYVYTIDISQ